MSRFKRGRDPRGECGRFGNRSRTLLQMLGEVFVFAFAFRQFQHSEHPAVGLLEALLKALLKTLLKTIDRRAVRVVSGASLLKLARPSGLCARSAGNTFMARSMARSQPGAWCRARGKPLLYRQQPAKPGFHTDRVLCQS